ncbi:MAG: hypothetical protein ACI8PZ_000834 [Myxococcota bacterium]|jgi:uncharacterized protein (TIGR04552 family)
MRRDILELDASLDNVLFQLDIDLGDIEAVRLLLSGGSVVDWQRLAFRDLHDVDRFLATHLLDPSVEEDRLRLRYVFNEAVSYLEEHLGLTFPRELRDPEDVRSLFLWASEYGGFRRTQILSCVILKLMHVIHHMESADLKFRTPISEEHFVEIAYANVLQSAREMQEAGLPIVSFYGNRKSRSSVITKLLAKAENIAATIFDKLRFRIVVDSPADLAPTLAYMTRHMFPFNYVIPAQSHNNLLDPATLLAALDELERDATQALRVPESHDVGKNEFSGTSYRMINFIVDYPVRVPVDALGPLSFELGRTVFVMVEFQVVDAETAEQNEQGDSAHHLYKERQERVVERRLKRGGGRSE